MTTPQFIHQVTPRRLLVEVAKGGDLLPMARETTIAMIERIEAGPTFPQRMFGRDRRIREGRTEATGIEMRIRNGTACHTVSSIIRNVGGERWMELEMRTKRNSVRFVSPYEETSADPSLDPDPKDPRGAASRLLRIHLTVIEAAASGTACFDEATRRTMGSVVLAAKGEKRGRLARLSSPTTGPAYVEDDGLGRWHYEIEDDPSVPLFARLGIRKPTADETSIWFSAVITQPGGDAVDVMRALARLDGRTPKP